MKMNRDVPPPPLQKIYLKLNDLESVLKPMQASKQYNGRGKGSNSHTLTLPHRAPKNSIQKL